MVNLICVGKVSSKPMQELIKEYVKRIDAYAKFRIIEIKEANKGDIKSNIKQESNDIISHLSNGVNILFDINGKNIKSEEIADLLNKNQINSLDTTFIIGGSDGVSDEVKDLCKLKICFGNVTFPHQLFRVLAVEQIYRGFSIINNSKYHK